MESDSSTEEQFSAKDSDSSTEEQYLTRDHQDLAELSLQEVQKLRNKIGIKQFNKRYGLKGASLHKQPAARTKRGKKSGPMEVSSKRPADTIRSTSIAKKPVTRDPRFDDLSGTYNDQVFKRSYKFIDRLKAKELKAVKKIAEDEQLDDETRKKAKDMLTRMGQKKAAKKEISAETKVENTLKAERKKAMREGQQPYFIKASEKNKLILAEKYKELKRKGQLDTFMKKKRMQNAKNDSGSMPDRTER